MIDKQVLAYAKLLHGSFNAFLMLLFIYQGWLGLRIRSIRKTGLPPVFTVMRKHRKLGPVLAPLGVSGFLSGATMVYLDKAHVFEYPLHFITGLTVSLAIVTTVLISTRIRAGESSWRPRHLAVGVVIIGLYMIQVVLGLSILL
jgi:hypothetical protein